MLKHIFFLVGIKFPSQIFFFRKIIRIFAVNNIKPIKNAKETVITNHAFGIGTRTLAGTAL